MNTDLNYITDTNFDFYSELNDLNEDNNSNICMISHEPLTYNSITLPCKHSFNYLPIYNEICLHTNISQNNHRKPVQKKNIICPYCRSKCEKLLPFIPLPTVTKLCGVNWPEASCMPSPKCSYIIKYGKKKGMPCNSNGIENEHGIICSKHDKPNTINTINNVNNVSNDWSPEKEKVLKTYSVAELRVMLKEKGLKISGLKKELVNRLFIPLK
jgi:hypothetical protein